MIISLEPWEYVHACNVGIGRFATNYNTYYKKVYMEDDRTSYVASAIAELAVAKATNKYWSGHVERQHSDVGNNILVRRVRSGSTVTIRNTEVGKGLILFVAQPEAPEFTQVDIWGWIRYDDAWELASPAHSETTRVLSRDNLTSLGVLDKSI